MRKARPLLRRLAAILGIVALFVLAPTFAEAHAGHGPDHVSAGGHLRNPDSTLSTPFSPAQTLAIEVMRPSLSAADPSFDGCACRRCCCGHVFVAVPDAELGRADRMSGRRIAMGQDCVHPSAVAEALPEPPRPFA